MAHIKKKFLGKGWSSLNQCNVTTQPLNQSVLGARDVTGASAKQISLIKTAELNGQPSLINLYLKYYFFDLDSTLGSLCKLKKHMSKPLPLKVAYVLVCIGTVTCYLRQHKFTHPEFFQARKSRKK